VKERLGLLSHELSAVTVMIHSRIAERVGLSATDHKCLDLAVRAECPLTAGQIAEMSGLSTGAITGVIDRLERAGFVRRVRDPHDRRKVLVEVSPASLSRYGDAFERVSVAAERVMSRYTPDELRVIERYITEMIDAMHTELSRRTNGK